MRGGCRGEVFIGGRKRKEEVGMAVDERWGGSAYPATSSEWRLLDTQEIWGEHSAVVGDAVEHCRNTLYYTVNTLSFFKACKRCASKSFCSGVPSHQSRPQTPLKMLQPPTPFFHNHLARSRHGLTRHHTWPLFSWLMPMASSNS